MAVTKIFLRISFDRLTGGGIKSMWRELTDKIEARLNDISITFGIRYIIKQFFGTAVFIQNQVKKRNFGKLEEN